MKKGKILLFLGLLFMMTSVLAVHTFAGWEQNKKGTKTWYTNETGERVTGVVKIGRYTYCFNQGGLLQTGWTATDEGLRYFDTEGKAGKTLGKMFSGGVFQIGKYRYGFDENGIVLTGLTMVGRYWFYFNTSEEPGVRGRAVVNKFVNLPDGRRAFFQDNGRMAFKKWVRDKKYYLDETGNLLRNTVTPGGYLVNAKGKAVKKLSNEFFKINGKTYFYKKNKLLKNKVFRYKGSYYYVDADGVRQTGWITWKDHKYFFRKNGKAVTGKAKVGGVYYVFNNKGQLEEEDDNYSTGTKSTTGRASILILCGHGQGDTGAVGNNSCGYFYENKMTREFGTLVYEELSKSDKVDAYIFNKNYDMYQQLRSALNSAGITSSVTGNGKNRKKTLNAIKNNSVIPDLTKYDFVLEIHFNATAVSSKDPSGDGNMKGTGTYVNAYKTTADRGIDKKIIKYLNNCGMVTWGSGVYGSSGLLNARTFTEIGVNYSLLETCFIDDNDDMKFYNKNRDQMAKQVSQAVIDYYK